MQEYNGRQLDGEYVRSLYENYKLTGDATDYNNLFFRWYDYSYGGMYDYVTGEDSVRVVKYAMDTYLGFGSSEDVYGAYNIYTNNFFEV